MDVQFNKENNSLLNRAGVTYLTSTALRGIILLQKELDKRDGDLIIEDPQEAVMEILDLVGMASFLEIRKTSE